MIAKAKLTIVLKADETIVAEIEDPTLWQRVLGIINQPKTGNDVRRDSLVDLDQKNDTLELGVEGEEGIARFAKRLGATVEVVVGALSPSREAPYLHIDAHTWEAFKRNFPKRGPGSVSPIGLAGTALVLWVKEAKLDVAVTQALASAVLDTVHVKDPNPSRGIKNTKWLQARAGGVIIVNPAEISKAQQIIGSFCLKKAPGNEA